MSENKNDTNHMRVRIEPLTLDCYYPEDHKGDKIKIMFWQKDPHPDFVNALWEPDIVNATWAWQNNLTEPPSLPNHKTNDFRYSILWLTMRNNTDAEEVVEKLNGKEFGREILTVRMFAGTPETDVEKVWRENGEARFHFREDVEDFFG